MSNYAMAGGIPSEHFHIADSVYVADGCAGMDQSRTVYSSRAEERRRNKRVPTISFKWAASLIALCILAFSLMIGINAVNRKALNGKINTMNREIAAITAENHSLNLKVLDARDSTRISYQAVQELGMVSAESTETYYVTAPPTRQGAGY